MPRCHIYCRVSSTGQENGYSLDSQEAACRSYAAAQGHVYLDYFSAMIDGTGHLRTELSEDDLHPNSKGYALMGPLAEAAIQTALK